MERFISSGSTSYGSIAVRFPRMERWNPPWRVSPRLAVVTTCCTSFTSAPKVSMVWVWTRSAPLPAP
jgi:hypothetical protein